MSNHVLSKQKTFPLSVGEVDGEAEAELARVYGVVGEGEVVLREPALVQVAAHQEETHFVQTARQVDVGVYEVADFHRVRSL